MSNRLIDNRYLFCAYHANTHRNIHFNHISIHASVDELINLLSGINRNNLSIECFYFVIYLPLLATGNPEALWSDKFACHLAWAAGI